MTEKVELTWYEAKLATEVGVNRCLSSWAKGLKHAHGYKPDDLFDTNIISAAAEMAVAKYCGLYWDGSVDTFKSKADVGSDIEVRLSMMKEPRLIIRPGDTQGSRYVLVKNLWKQSSTPQFQILGYYRYSKRLMHDKWWTNFGKEDRPHCWAIPVQDLLDL